MLRNLCSSAFKDFKSRINLARTAFSRLQFCLWTRREISLRTKGRVYQAVRLSILLYGCETWPVRKAHERMLEAFDNDSIRRILRVRHKIVCHPLNCVAASALQVYRHCWCKEGSTCLVMLQGVPKGELIMDLHLPTLPRTLRRQTEGQLKTWATTIKAYLELLSDRESSATHDGERTE